MITFYLFLILSAAYPESAKISPGKLYLDLPAPERIEKRLRLAEEITSGQNKTGYTSDEADSLYALNVKEDPKHTRSWFNWIKKVMNKSPADSLKKAEDLLALAKRNNPGHPLLDLAQVMILSKKKAPFAEFRDTANKVKSRAGDLTFDDLLLLSEVYSGSGEPANALDVCSLMEKAATTPAEKITVQQRRGLLGKTSKNWETCVDGYRKTAALGAGGIPVQSGLVYCLRELNRIEEALAIADKVGDVGEMTCERAALRTKRGFQFSSDGDLQKALELGTAARSACPNPETARLLATLALKKQDYKKAHPLVLEAAAGAENKVKFLREWSRKFKGEPPLKLDILLESYKLIVDPEVKMALAFTDAHMMHLGNDPGFVEFVRKAKGWGDELAQDNQKNIEFMRNYSALYTVYGINRGSPKNLAKARELLGKTKSLGPDPDRIVEKSLSDIGRVEKNIRDGVIKPSEP